MTQPSGNDSGRPSSGGGPSGSGAPLNDASARRLAVALELFARRAQVGSPAAAALANRDRGGADPVTLAALATVTTAGGKGRGAGAPTNTPQPVVVVGWRAGPINVNIAGAMNAAKGLDAANSFEDSRRRAGDKQHDWSEMWKKLNAAPKGKPAGDPEGGGGAPGTGVAKALAMKFGAVLAPLVAFATVMGAANSGASAFGKAVSALGVTLAPLILPPMILLTTAVLAVGDVLWNRLRPHISAFAAWMVEKGVPAIETFVGVVEKAAKALGAIGGGGNRAERMAKGEYGFREARAEADTVGLGGFADWLRKKTQPLRDAVPQSWLPGPTQPRAAPAEGAGGDTLGTGGRPRDIAALGPPAAGGGGWAEFVRNRVLNLPRPTPAPGSREGVTNNLNMVMTSLVRSLGPKAEYTTAAGAAKARQIAGANGDPLDMQALLRAIESLNETQKGVRAGVDRLNNPTAPQVPPSGGAR